MQNISEPKKEDLTEDELLSFLNKIHSEHTDEESFAEQLIAILGCKHNLSIVIANKEEDFWKEFYNKAINIGIIDTELRNPTKVLLGPQRHDPLEHTEFSPLIPDNLRPPELSPLQVAARQAAPSPFGSTDSKTNLGEPGSRPRSSSGSDLSVGEEEKSYALSLRPQTAPPGLAGRV